MNRPDTSGSRSTDLTSPTTTGTRQARRHVHFEYSWKFGGPAKRRGPMGLLLVWLINAVALMAVAYLLPGIAVSSFITALVAALVLGLVNAVIRPILVLLTLPATLL